MNILVALKERFARALTPLVDDPSPALEMIRPAQDPRFGDYQANCAMALGKQLRRPPREIAEQIVANLDVADMCHDPQVAGPGFINLRLRDDWLTDQLRRLVNDPRLGVEPVAQGKTIVVDFSSPNVAKPMHVGHIRSTVIGDAICRTLRFVGHRVIADNHLGDWGTQFGMIIYGYRHFLDPEAYAQQPVAELGRVYRQVRQIIDVLETERKLPLAEDRVAQLGTRLAQMRSEAESTDDRAAGAKHQKAVRKLQAQLDAARQELGQLQDKLEASRHDAALMALVEQHRHIERAVLDETARLHGGDEDNLALWREFLPKCREEIQRIYDRLDVHFDQELGESFYHDRLGEVVRDLVDRGLARESEGAICLFLQGFDSPMIVRKSDGAFLYSTTDLATIAYRMETWSPDAILYVVDFRQGEHFEKLFAAARQWGYDQVDLRHIAFGTVLGEDGKPFKTRSGDTVGLEGLLDAAVQRALQVVTDNDLAKPTGPELNDQQRRDVARVVGHGAIKYADLSQNRLSDYVYSEEKMVALRGNTAAYLQYSYARVQNIFAKGEVDVEQLRTRSELLTIQHDKERQLAIQLLRLPEAIDEMLADYRPNALTNYLYDLATKFSEFYEHCPVLKAENAAQRESRLLLCDLVARTLKLGLSLLGIDVVQKM